MIKKILLPLLIFSSLSLANSKQEQIANTKAQIQKLQESLKKLEASIPQTLVQKKENTFKTHTEFGFISTSGNTDTTAYGLDLNLQKKWGKHVLNFNLDRQYAEDDNIETKNKFLAELGYDYELTERFAFNYLLGYKRDKFSGYDYRLYTGPGVKYKLIKKENHTLSLEGNLLYSQDKIEDTEFTSAGETIHHPNPDNLVTDSSKTIQGSTRDYASFRTKAGYEWQILDNLTFTQDLSYRAEVDDTQNYFVFSKTALISKISDIFSLGLSYKYDYANTPPQGKENADKTFSASLIIDY